MESKIIFMESNNLFKREVFWKQHSINRRYYYTVVDDRIIYLRMNNFPDEPLYTLINDLDILDIEDRPPNWTLE
jgi:hypothetical protein